MIDVSCSKLYTAAQKACCIMITCMLCASCCLCMQSCWRRTPASRPWTQGCLHWPELHHVGVTARCVTNRHCSTCDAMMQHDRPYPWLCSFPMHYLDMYFTLGIKAVLITVCLWGPCQLFLDATGRHMCPWRCGHSAG